MAVCCRGTGPTMVTRATGGWGPGAAPPRTPTRATATTLSCRHDPPTGGTMDPGTAGAVTGTEWSCRRAIQPPAAWRRSSRQVEATGGRGRRGGWWRWRGQRVAGWGDADSQTAGQQWGLAAGVSGDDVLSWWGCRQSDGKAAVWCHGGGGAVDRGEPCKPGERASEGKRRGPDPIGKRRAEPATLQ